MLTPTPELIATERMYNALRAVVVGPDWGALTPSYLPQPWTNETIAAALGIDITKEAPRG